MAGGNRPYTLQDVLGQLNQDSGATSSDTAFEVNVLVVDSEALGLTDSVEASANGTSFSWDTPNTVQTRTNLAANPSFEAASGTVVLRTNMATNPNVEGGLTGWLARTNCSIALSTTSPIAGTQSCVATTNTTTGATVEFSNGIDQGHAVQITGGQTYTISVYVNSLDSAGSGSITIDWFTAGNPAGSSTGATYLGSSTQSATSLTQGTVTRLSITVTAPSNAVQFQPYFTFSGYAASGNRIMADSVLIEQVATLGAYFDGTTAAAGDFTYAWSGPVNGSSSWQQAPDVTWWNKRWFGSGGGAGASYQSKGTALDRSSVLRKFWTVADTTPAQDTGINTPNLPVTPGAVYTASISMRPTITAPATTLVPYIVWLDSNQATISNTSTSGVSAPNGVWTRASVTATAPSNAAYAQFVFGPYAGASTMAAGDYLDFDQCLIEQASSLGSYFDGATASSQPQGYVPPATWNNAWTAAADASTSTATLTQQALWGTVAWQ